MKISQAEARRLRAKYEQLKARVAGWNTAGSPGGFHMGKLPLDTSGWLFGRLQTARRLGCVLVCTVDDHGCLNYHAVKP